MLNKMNKRINSLSWSGMLGIEKQEHGMAKKPTSAQMPKMEMKEHGLKKAPSKAQIMAMEKKEHIKNGKVVIGKGMKG
jgi:hypothetical protein